MCFRSFPFYSKKMHGNTNRNGKSAKHTTSTVWFSLTQQRSDCETRNEIPLGQINVGFSFDGVEMEKRKISNGQNHLWFDSNEMTERERKTKYWMGGRFCETKLFLLPYTKQIYIYISKRKIFPFVSGFVFPKCESYNRSYNRLVLFSICLVSTCFYESMLIPSKFRSKSSNKQRIEVQDFAYWVTHTLIFCKFLKSKLR